VLERVLAQAQDAFLVEVIAQEACLVVEDELPRRAAAIANVPFWD
jgi:hypothetical protein